MFQCSRIYELLRYFLCYGNIVDSFFLLFYSPVLPCHVPTKRYYDKTIFKAIVRSKEKTPGCNDFNFLFTHIFSRAKNIVPMSIEIL
jgi:hypothetical protein